ncbi:MAG: ATP-binding protein [Clostridiales bacterium]|nr:ATP-binding protein [Clostridiales bacterium]
MEIKRDVYLNEMILRLHNGMIKVITGIRRCGKSYLMNSLFYRYLIESVTDESHILRFAFDSAEDLGRIGEDPVALAREKRKVSPEKFMRFVREHTPENGSFYLLLDEIQELDCFEAVLNGYLRNPLFEIYVTGSNSRFLSTDILTEFEGRGDEIRIYPLSFAEFTSVYSGTPDEAWDEYMTYGGLPALAMMKTETQKIRYLETQLNNVYLKDIIVRKNLSSDTNLPELLDVLASGMSTLVNPNILEGTFRSEKKVKLSAPTISQYITYLQEAFLINTVKRYDVKGKKYINTPYKIYFEDTGLRNARLAFRQTEPSHLMENIVYMELRRRGFLVDIGVVEIRERNADGQLQRKQLEIDFIANLGSKRYYIQSAYEIPDETKRAQEIKSFNYAGDSFKKIILVEKNIKPKRDEHGYVTMGIREFLLDQNSLDL